MSKSLGNTTLSKSKSTSIGSTKGVSMVLVPGQSGHVAVVNEVTVEIGGQTEEKSISNIDENVRTGSERSTGNSSSSNAGVGEELNRDAASGGEGGEGDTDCIELELDTVTVSSLTTGRCKQ
jgi:hypothetical protein